MENTEDHGSTGGIGAGDETGGDFYGAMGAKIGSGAAKVGKKAAQSEAGRSAGKAAMKGAVEGAQQDLSQRYLGGQSGAPVTAEPPTATKSASSSSPSKSQDSGSYTHSSHHHHTSQSHSSSSSGGSKHSHPPKPSIFSKYKVSINVTAKPPPKKRQVQPSSRGKVYKYRLAKEADWDRLPLAQALFHFKGELKCDLEFRKGQVIQIITRTENQFDWWEGKIEDRVGIFPANYVKLI